jgi:peptidoglycan/xylan/chitin deacetylase (PgdA/CDA1 family)
MQNNMMWQKGSLGLSLLAFEATVREAEVIPKVNRIVFGFAGLLLVSPLLAQTRPPVWEWELPEIEATVNKIRAGRDLTPKKWPSGARVAVAITFDMDCESNELSSGSPQALSRAEYAARVGMPRILRMLERQKVPATFFIPAVDGLLHPDAADAILKSPLKHEIGIHGWIHESIVDLKPGEEEKLTRRAFEWWTKRVGCKPVGIRTPAWDFTNKTYAIIRELGLDYDSSLMADDRPYEIVAEGKPTGLVELPVEWILDDYAYFSFDLRSNMYHRIGDEEVFEIYKAEFDQACEEGTLFLLTLHPLVSGHRSRLAMVERLLTYIRSKPEVWFGTLDQVAMAARAQLVPAR